MSDDPSEVRSALEAELSEAKAQIAKLREALRWYANAENYNHSYGSLSAALFDEGDQARAALRD